MAHIASRSECGNNSGGDSVAVRYKFPLPGPLPSYCRYHFCQPDVKWWLSLYLEEDDVKLESQQQHRGASRLPYTVGGHGATPPDDQIPLSVDHQQRVRPPGFNVQADTTRLAPEGVLIVRLILFHCS